MRAATVLLILTGLKGLAQDAHWRPDTLPDPRRWAVGAELLRPVIDLISSTAEDRFMRLEGVAQHWLRPDIGLRLSAAYDDLYTREWEPPQESDSIVVTRITTNTARSFRIGAGVTIQKRREAFLAREKHFAPLVGLALLLGREDRSVRQEDQAYRRDSTGVNVPIAGTDVVRWQEDRMFFTGLELTPGLSGPLGDRWEVDLRLPIEVTWWTVLDRSSMNAPSVPAWWDEPVNFGVRLPRLYVLYRW